MIQVGLNILWVIVKAIFSALRFTWFVVLLLAGRVIVPIASLASGMGLLIFLFCALFHRDQVMPMWAGAGLAVGSGMVIFFYSRLLALVAPEGAVIFSVY